MSETKRLWIGLGLLLAATFAVLLWMGGEVYRSAPPMPERVVTSNGELIYSRDDIETGRQVRQSTGGTFLWTVFSVIFMLAGIGLMLFCLRGLEPLVVWNDSPPRTAFLTLNIGLGLMALLTLLPMGVLQLQAARRLESNSKQ